MQFVNTKLMNGDNLNMNKIQIRGKQKPSLAYFLMRIVIEITNIPVSWRCAHNSQLERKPQNSESELTTAEVLNEILNSIWMESHKENKIFGGEESNL